MSVSDSRDVCSYGEAAYCEPAEKIIYLVRVLYQILANGFVINLHDAMLVYISNVVIC